MNNIPSDAAVQPSKLGSIICKCLLVGEQLVEENIMRF